MRAELFLGLPLTEPLKNEFTKTDPRLFDMFVNEMTPYLKTVNHDGVIFIGKEASCSSDIAKIKLLEANIYSILSKILPHYPFKTYPLLLFATILRD